MPLDELEALYWPILHELHGLAAQLQEAVVGGMPAEPTGIGAMLAMRTHGSQARGTTGIKVQYSHWAPGIRRGYMKYGLSPSLPGLFNPRFLPVWRAGSTMIWLIRSLTLLRETTVPLNGWPFSVVS